MVLHYRRKKTETTRKRENKINKFFYKKKGGKQRFLKAPTHHQKDRNVLRGFGNTSSPLLTPPEHQLIRAGCTKKKKEKEFIKPQQYKTTTHIPPKIIHFEAMAFAL